MARVLLDTCVPRRLSRALSGHDVTTAQREGLDKLEDGDLLDRIEGRFDFLITRDRNIEYQQSWADRTISLIVLRVKVQSPESFDALVPDLLAALSSLDPGQVCVVGPDPT